MSIDPFIKAEEVKGRSVSNACRLLEVSRAAYYQRRLAIPSPRAVSDDELAKKITAIHTESKGTYGSPRVHRALRKQGTECRKRRAQAHGPSGPGGPGKEAVEDCLLYTSPSPRD